MSTSIAAAAESIGPDERDILYISNEWGKAIVSNDAEAIGRFMTDDWIMVSNTGIADKQRFLSFVASGDLTHESMEMAELATIRIYGDTAVVAARVTNIAHYRGETFDANEWTTDVFIKSDGTWKCVLSHITPVDPR